jgi:GT2 family glycosyltransferase
MALNLAQSKYIAFIDNDVEVNDIDWLPKLVLPLDRDKTIAITGPKILFHDRPSIIQSAGGGVSHTGRVCDIGRNYSISNKKFNQKRYLQFQSSACLVCRRKIALSIGGFDTIFDPVLYEEIDFCYRIRQAKYKILYVPEAEILHHENSTTFQSSQINGKYLFIKHGLLFKERWRSIYTAESGPTDQEVKKYNRRENIMQ